MSYASTLWAEAETREAAMEGQAEEEAREVERLRAIYERGVARLLDADDEPWMVREFASMFGNILWQASIGFGEFTCATEQRALTIAIEYNDELWQRHLGDLERIAAEASAPEQDNDDIPF